VICCVDGAHHDGHDPAVAIAGGDDDLLLRRSEKGALLCRIKRLRIRICPAEPDA
jgi:hypothetical protein